MSKDTTHRVSFPSDDYYYKADLDKFYGPRVIEDHDSMIESLGRDGKNFCIDEYRTWLMKVLQQEGFTSFESAYTKYPFLKYEDPPGVDNDSEDEN